MKKNECNVVLIFCGLSQPATFFFEKNAGATDVQILIWQYKLTGRYVDDLYCHYKKPREMY